MDNLSDLLKQEAIERRLCAEWTDGWADNSDQQTLIEKYKDGIDFVLKQGEWPSNNFIRENFDRDLLHSNLVFVDEELSIERAPSGVYILNGACSGTICLEPWSAATIYVRHDSNVRIIASDFAKVQIRLFDNGEAEVERGIEASAVVLHRKR